MVEAPDRIHIRKRVAEGGWMVKHSRIGDDPEETTEDEFRDREGIVVVHNGRQPSAAPLMLKGIDSIRRD